ncbi:hypothetical protein LZZ90_10210 [Flavobacterium sp. SM15]|uniref:hypothetical protein n=1 Tax=Flavobacterium sp. SM15 TaxID=2908005 RepID=UPI001EDC2235|nr:hypothetical protein [Flavobacterium sp. SM15]MCG2611878.1 hypothetical protein [Flavobacterium sp. SM15]
MKFYLTALFLFALQQLPMQAQQQKTIELKTIEHKVKFAAYDGMIIAGYVDKGAFLNFTGPNINWSYNSSKIMLGMLPSLRIKEDNKTPKNSTITPSLGVGLTYCYKKIAFQLPMYYNTKTAASDGKWNIGIGLGIRLKS